MTLRDSNGKKMVVNMTFRQFGATLSHLVWIVSCEAKMLCFKFEFFENF